MRAFLRRLLRPRRDPDRPPSHGIAIPRNIIASGIATSFEAIGIPLLVELGHVHYMIAVMSCAVVATTISFFLNKYWVFEAHRGRAQYQYVKQLLVASGSFVGNSSLIFLLTEYAGLHYYLSFCCSNVVIFFCWNYPASRFIVFSDGHRRRERLEAETDPPD